MSLPSVVLLHGGPEALSDGIHPHYCKKLYIFRHDWEYDGQSESRLVSIDVGNFVSGVHTGLAVDEKPWC